MILVTGANGFVGQAVAATLDARGIPCRRLVRAPAPSAEPGTFCGDLLAPELDWDVLLRGVDCVVHCAARAHVMDETEKDPLSAFRLANVEASHRLALAAAARGVRRLIYLSSIKVNGESTPAGEPFSALSPPQPRDPYGQSKWEAEQALMQVAAATALEVVTIRPPLIYGPGVKGNFLGMMRLLMRRIPLPFGAVHNARSLLALDNLVDLLLTCTHHPAAAGQCLLVSDGDDFSTTSLLRQLGEALGRPARLLPVPAGWLRTAARLSGKEAVVDRLLGNLQIDRHATCALLDWQPPFTTHTALGKTARWYLETA